MKLSTTLWLAGSMFLLTHVANASEANRMQPAITTLEGTWTLAFADVQHPDGTRGHDYGDAPKGVLQVDHAGHYAMFIFNSSRPKFAANDRSKGTPEEFRAAVLGTSSHFGTVTIDPATHTLTFHIEGATYPNWEGTTQVRHYVMNDGVLSYKVAARPNGDIPMTGWKRVMP